MTFNSLPAFIKQLLDSFKPNPLADILRADILCDGPITIERFMEIALHHPDYGYYQHGDFLSAGNADFATAPEISQLFGEMVAVWLLDAWQKIGAPTAFTLLELGPGRGSLMKDVLTATASIQPFQQALHLHLLESNATLRDLQQQRLSAYNPTQLEQLDALPPLPLLAIANEFFDTLPLRQFMRTKRGWRERLIAVKGRGFAFVAGDEATQPPVYDSAGHRALLPPGAFFEVSPQAQVYTRQIAQHVAHYGGGALFIDYGYDRPRGTDTLIAIKQRRFRRNVFAALGKSDITANVDFCALKNAAEACGIGTNGPIEQGDFLRLMGIEARAAVLRENATDRQIRKIDKDMRHLTGATKMGTAFKVLALYGVGDNSAGK